MPKRVLVTRPETAATDTANRLRDLGFEPVVLPLSRTVALPAGALPQAVEVAAVTSANALLLAPPDLVAQLLQKPCFLVGERTGAVARELGFGDVIVGSGTASGLARLVAERTDKSARIAYLCGRVRRPDFETALAELDYAVMAVETYDTIAIQPSQAELDAAFVSKPVEAVLVYSEKAAEALNALAGRAPGIGSLENALFCCLSNRIAGALDIGGVRVVVADRPEQQALFHVLRQGG